MHPVILRLESAGLLERNARNQRVVLLRPTKQGRSALGAATGRIRAAERAAFAAMSEEDEATVRAWLARLAATTTRRGHADADLEEKQ
jgi:DNA-binding MarR family transcriptional regulator